MSVSEAKSLDGLTCKRFGGKYVGTDLQIRSMGILGCHSFDLRWHLGWCKSGNANQNPFPRQRVPTGVEVNKNIMEDALEQVWHIQAKPFPRVFRKPIVRHATWAGVDVGMLLQIRSRGKEFPLGLTCKQNGEYAGTHVAYLSQICSLGFRMPIVSLRMALGLAQNWEC